MNEFENVLAEKTNQILKILEGLNVYQAKKIIESIIYGVERNSLVHLESE